MALFILLKFLFVAENKHHIVSVREFVVKVFSSSYAGAASLLGDYSKKVNRVEFMVKLVFQIQINFFEDFRVGFYAGLTNESTYKQKW